MHTSTAYTQSKKTTTDHNMSSSATAGSTIEPKSPSSQTSSPLTRPYLTIAKLVSSLLVLILTIITASIWPRHLHPVFLSTLFTCFITFTILIYSHTHASSDAPNCSHHITTLLLLHLLPFILWVVSSVLASIWTYTYNNTTWRTGSILDAQRKYLADLPPGLTPAKIASDYFRRHRTVKYTAAVKVTGVCAGLAGLTAIFFVVSGVGFIKSVRQVRRSRAARNAHNMPSSKVSGYGWLTAVVARVRRRETLPVTENENKVKAASSSSAIPEHRAD